MGPYAAAPRAWKPVWACACGPRSIERTASYHPCAACVNCPRAAVARRGVGAPVRAAFTCCWSRNARVPYHLGMRTTSIAALALLVLAGCGKSGSTGPRGALHGAVYGVNGLAAADA